MSKNIPSISEQKYDHYIGKGYLLHKEEEDTRGNFAGRYVVLRKPVGGCEQVSKITCCLTLGVLFFPILCLFNALDHYDCMENAVVGYKEKKFFVVDAAATKERRELDYLPLGIDLNSLEDSLQTYVQRQKKEGNRPKEHNGHYYMTFYGPETNFSYVILIPSRDYSKIQLYPVENHERKPCSKEELESVAKQLCQNYNAATHTSTYRTLQQVGKEKEAKRKAQSYEEEQEYRAIIAVNNMRYYAKFN